MREWEKNIRRVEPYIPGEQPKDDGIIKLNTNENPYPPSPEVVEAMNNIKCTDFRKYPDPTCEELRDALAADYGFDRSNIFVGVGSDDVLSMVFLTFFNSGKPVLFPDITYSFYKVWAGVYGIPYATPALDENFNIRAEDYYGENGGVVIANPNAPTGIFRETDFIEDILRHNRDVIVVVDEAYIDFAGNSATELLDRYENLIVVQTFSKSKSMAGMRVGMAIAGAELIAALENVKYSINSYTLNRTSLAAGTAAAKSRSYYERTAGKIVNTRERISGELKKRGFECTESGANFIFAKHGKVSGKMIYEYLKENKIYVRRFDAPRISEYLRISVGSDEEMDKLLELLDRYPEFRKI